MRRLLLMRHAEARAGPDQTEGQLFSTADEPLSEAGRRQAEAMGQRVARAPYAVDGVHASPAVRCRQTARTVAEHLDGEREVREHEDLLEIPYREPGTSYREVLDTIVATARELRGDPDPELPTGTSWQQATGRFADALEAILAEGGTRLVVAHGAQNRAWLTSLLGMPAHRLFFLEQDHACLNVVAYGDEHPAVQKLNLTPEPLAGQGASLADDGEPPDKGH
jgi:broad specificity phosphatase PhoE